MKRVMLILALVLVGCGESEEDVREALLADRQAAERQDFAQMCALRTPDGRRDLMLCPDPTAPTPQDTTLGNEPIVTFNYTPGRITDVDVDGDRATVRRDGGGVTELRKVEGRWLIHSDR